MDKHRRNNIILPTEEEVLGRGRPWTKRGFIMMASFSAIGAISFLVKRVNHEKRMHALHEKQDWAERVNQSAQDTQITK